jgi:hypothetical protein
MGPLRPAMEKIHSPRVERAVGLGRLLKKWLVRYRPLERQNVILAKKNKIKPF